MSETAKRSRIKPSTVYFILVCIGLVLTSAAKLDSSFRPLPILSQADLVTGLTYLWEFRFVAVFEIAVVIWVLSTKSPIRKAVVLLSLFNVFLIYRITRHVFGLPMEDCPCMGLTPPWVPFSPGAMHYILNLYVAATIIGALLILLFPRRPTAAAE